MTNQRPNKNWEHLFLRPILMTSLLLFCQWSLACQVSCKADVKVKIDIAAKCMCVHKDCFRISTGDHTKGVYTTNGFGRLQAYNAGKGSKTRSFLDSSDSYGDRDAITTGIYFNDVRGKILAKEKDCKPSTTMGGVGVPCEKWELLKVLLAIRPSVEVCSGASAKDSRAKEGHKLVGKDLSKAIGQANDYSHIKRVPTSLEPSRSCTTQCHSHAKVKVDMASKCMCVGDHCFGIATGNSSNGVYTANGIGVLGPYDNGGLYRTLENTTTEYDKDAISMGVHNNNIRLKILHKVRDCVSKTTLGCIGVPCDKWPIVKEQMHLRESMEICNGAPADLVSPQSFHKMKNPKDALYGERNDVAL